jgi:ferredoxin-NADP reductase
MLLLSSKQNSQPESLFLVMELIFIRKIQNAGQIWSFFFEKPAALRFEAGDYVELSLAAAGPNGDKRWMSMASSPTEDELMFTSKISETPSAFKQTLLSLSAGDKAMCSPPIGNFNLPRDSSQKLLFVAGGIGITPYRSMLCYLADTDDSRDIVLVYIARAEEFIFGDVIEAAHIPVLQSSEKIDFNWLKKRVPDWQERICYFAGPQPMCEELYEQAQAAGIRLAQLRLDYFEGYNEL